MSDRLRSHEHASSPPGLPEDDREPGSRPLLRIDRVFADVARDVGAISADPRDDGAIVFSFGVEPRRRDGSRAVSAGHRAGATLTWSPVARPGQRRATGLEGGFSSEGLGDARLDALLTRLARVTQNREIGGLAPLRCVAEPCSEVLLSRDFVRDTLGCFLREDVAAWGPFVLRDVEEADRRAVVLRFEAPEATVVLEISDASRPELAEPGAIEQRTIGPLSVRVLEDTRSSALAASSHGGVEDYLCYSLARSVAPHAAVHHRPAIAIAPAHLDAGEVVGTPPHASPDGSREPAVEPAPSYVPRAHTIVRLKPGAELEGFTQGSAYLVLGALGETLPLVGDAGRVRTCEAEAFAVVEGLAPLAQSPVERGSGGMLDPSRAIPAGLNIVTMTRCTGAGDDGHPVAGFVAAVFGGLVSIRTGVSCNLRCAYCAVPKARNLQFSFAGIQRWVRTAKALGAPGISLTGGEPATHPRILDVVSSIREHGFGKLVLGTNGIALASSEFTERLVRAGVTIFSFSLDSFDRATQEDLFQGARVFDKVMKGLNNAASHDGIVVLMVCTVTSRNVDQLPSYIEQLAAFAGRERGRFPVLFNLMHRPDDASQGPRLRPDLLVAAERLREATDVGGATGVTVLTTGVPLCLLGPHAQSSLHAAVREACIDGESLMPLDSVFDGAGPHAVCGACRWAPVCPGVMSDYVAPEALAALRATPVPA